MDFSVGEKYRRNVTGIRAVWNMYGINAGFLGEWAYFAMQSGVAVHTVKPEPHWFWAWLLNTTLLLEIFILLGLDFDSLLLVAHGQGEA